MDPIAQAPPQVHFARTTFDEMLAYHQAHPAVQPTIHPYMKAPPPRELPFAANRAADTSGVGLDKGATEPGETETPVPGGPGPMLAAPPLIVNFAGTFDDNTNIPPDTHGAVGPAHVVNMLNTGFQVFDRTGGIVAPQITLQAFWAVLGTGAGQPAADPYDPKILYDQHSGRWVVVSDSNGFSTATRVLVGISLTSDPTGAWNLFAIDPDPGTRWADYPGLGVDAANVYVSNNMFTAAGAFSLARFWVISKASMIAGGALDLGVRTPPTGGFAFQPAHSFDNDPGGLNYFVDGDWYIDGTPLRFVKLTQFTGIGAATVMTELGFIEVLGYNFYILEAPQSNCATPIATNDTRIMNAVLRNGKVWATHHVGDGAPIDPADATKPEVAWYEMDPSAANFLDPSPPPIQQGHVEHPTLAYYFPSIAVNAVECVALGFSGSDADTFASAYYTLRDSIDSPGTMQAVGLLRAGEASYLKMFTGTRNRWGDYSATMIDPLDDLTFWTTQEYAEAPFSGGPDCEVDGGRWGLWWGSFQCTAPPPSPITEPTVIVKSRFISFS
ncbi:MAG: hypothetical protein Q7R41_08565, partial [Phycisphaerales bacterium]|nr:hypothetical protein [Phycisphaerales bacterium]